MHLLRTSSLLSRLVLAWFLLTVGAAIASPLVHPQALELVCATGNATKLVVVGDDGSNLLLEDLHTLDCPLCLHSGAPAPRPKAEADHPHPLAHALQPAMAANIAVLAGAPLPPRGPPTLVS